MTSRLLLILLAAIALLASSALAAELTAPDQVLLKKGLARVGNWYLLDVDAHLAQGLRSVRKATNQIDENTARRRQIEGQIKQAATALEQWNRQFRDVNEQRKNATGQRAEQLGAENNILITKMREGARYLDDREKALKNLPVPSDDLIAAVMDVSDKMEAAAKRYEELAADAEVQAAIKQLNVKGAAPIKLGPSPQFQQELKPMRKLRDSVDSGVVKLEFAGGVPHVTVTINGNVTERMVFDSGAAGVVIAPDLARKLGLHPGPNDQVLELQVANGQITKAHRMRLKSVRVGQFTAEDVECAVLPPDVKGDNLLGGTFLKHFVYHMDLGASELHLRQISGKPKVDGLLAARNLATTTATTAPIGWPAGEWAKHMNPATAKRNGDAIVITRDERIITDRPFAPPITFKIVAKTNSSNIRLAYASDSIIFNWEQDKTFLHIVGGPAGGKHKPGAGELPRNQWVNLELTVLPDSMIIKVNAKERYRAWADFSKVNEPLTIFTYGDAVVSIRSIVPSTPAETTVQETGPFKQRVTIEIEASIDGEDTLRLSRSGAKWTHQQYGWPSDVRINGKSWDVKSHGELMSGEQSAKFLQTLDFSDARVIEALGRSPVTSEPGEDGIVLKFSDPGSGADKYRVKVSVAQR
jgi:clan AA aspartic protease (TIGR02281 family)